MKHLPDIFQAICTKRSSGKANGNEPTQEKTTKQRRGIKAMITIVLSIVAAAAAIGAYIGYQCFAITTTSKAMVYVYPGATAESVEDSLATHYGASFAKNVGKIMEAIDVDWSRRTGAYTIQPGMSAYRVARCLTRGPQSPVRFTFNNVRTKKQFAERVASQMMMSADSLLAALDSDSLLAAIGCNRNNVVAILQPDTYEFYWNTSPQKFLTTMHRYYTQWWTPERLAKAEALGLTPQQVATVASIVEEETANVAERPTVARLYLNRLKIGMALQADPTVKFACGEFAARRITAAMLAHESPYNAYKHARLPPGPIRLPEKRTLDAVLNAPHHNYLYMCAKEDFSGGHNFTASYAEHQQNAARYHRALNARGIK